MSGPGSCRECGYQPRWGTYDLSDGLCNICYARTPKGKARLSWAAVKELQRLEDAQNKRCGLKKERS